jgi:D-alanyl-D-alanine carboxypeptidase
VGEVLTELALRVGLDDTALPAPDEIEMPEPAGHGHVNGPATDGLQRDGIDTGPLGDVSGYSPSWGGAGGAMYSTVEDLGTWAAAGFGNALLPCARRPTSAVCDGGIRTRRCGRPRRHARAHSVEG